MVKALIFDFDGLIVDTEGPHYQVWQETFVSFGCELPLEEWAVTIGTHGTFDPYDHLAHKLGKPIDRPAVRARCHARFDELMASQSILPGVGGYVEGARERGLRVGIASSSSRAWVGGFLARFGLTGSFDSVTCCDDVERIKPEPDLYVAALAALGVAPREAVAFEDSPNGVLAATRAGIFCVAVPNALTSRLELERADLRIASLADVPLDDLLARIGRR